VQSVRRLARPVLVDHVEPIVGHLGKAFTHAFAKEARPADVTEMRGQHGRVSGQGHHHLRRVATGLAAIVGAMTEDRAAASGERPTFSVVLPTSGRRTLARALASVSPQLEAGDEVILVRYDCSVQGDWARNSAVERAIASHLVFLDDDDEFVPDALARFRRFAIEHPGRIGLFRMQLPTGDLIWSEPVFAYGQVGGPTMVIPNLPGKLGRWAQTEIGNDWAFVEETVRLQRTEPVFRDEIVARVRPDGTFGSRWDAVRYRLRLGSRVRHVASIGR